MAATTVDRSRVALVAAALLATVASGVLTLVSGNDPAAPVPPRVLGEKITKPPAPLSFTLAASVKGLKPGVPARLPVVVTNPNDGTLTVKTLFVVPRDSGACSGANVTVQPYDAAAPGATPYTAAAGRSVTVPLTVVLLDRPDVDQTACRGRTVPLTVNAVADVAS